MKDGKFELGDKVISLPYPGAYGLIEGEIYTIAVLRTYVNEQWADFLELFPKAQNYNLSYFEFYSTTQDNEFVEVMKGKERMLEI